jgi:D-alanyl-D-alanine-carboxypeptidase/D-alanyl-D-alanine-endopeptidase
MLQIIRRTVYAALLAGIMATLAAAQARQTSNPFKLPSDADIRKILADRIDTLAGQEDGIGIVVGVVGPQGRRVTSYGHLKQGHTRSLNGDTVFEIGSVGKVFTALLLADMVQKGEVALADPVAKYLPANVKLPERNGRQITLVDLVTHTSGLPFMPDDVPVVDESAAIKYGPQQLYQFLARYELPRDPGAEWDYSNIDYWLLGQALASRAGTDFQNLLRARVIAPLNLQSTDFPLPLSAKLKSRLAVGHNAVLQPAPDFYATSIYAAVGPEAGGLVSSVNDLLTLLSVAMGYRHSPLASSMASMLDTRRPIDGSEQALGWVVTGKGEDELVTHEGSTWGYASYIAWEPGTRVGVVVLSNQLTAVADIGNHLLKPGTPLEPPTVTRHTEISLESKILDARAGHYDAKEEGVFLIVRERDFLTIQMPVGWGLPKFRLRPESSRDFFVAELPIRVTFQTDTNGHVNGILVYPPRGQHALPAHRISLHE